MALNLNFQQTTMNNIIETFQFDLPPTLNDQINSARNNRFANAQIKKVWTDAIAMSCQGKTKFPDKVWMEFSWYLKNSRRDPDNVQAAKKFILDGMVQAEIIVNDNLKIIQSPIIEFFYHGQVDGQKLKDDFVIVRVSNKHIWKMIEADLPLKIKLEFESA